MAHGDSSSGKSLTQRAANVNAKMHKPVAVLEDGMGRSSSAGRSGSANRLRERTNSGEAPLAGTMSCKIKARALAMKDQRSGHVAASSVRLNRPAGKPGATKSPVEPTSSSGSSNGDAQPPSSPDHVRGLQFGQCRWPVHTARGRGRTATPHS